MSSNVVVIGSYAVGLVMRTVRLPAKGETVVATDFATMHGGKGSNQAIACARLGARVSFVAAVGVDDYGFAALALLQSENVDTSHVRRISDAPTGVGFITVDADGDNAIAIALGANERLCLEDIDRAEALIARADVVLAQLEIPPSVAVYAMAVARKHGVRTILNPAPAQTLSPADLAHIDVLTPNLTEARTLSGLSRGDAHACGQALQQLGVGQVIVTAGEAGAWIVDGISAPALIPTLDVDALDTTGAGDAFSAALAVAFAEGTDRENSVAFACAAGAYSVQSPGTVPSYPTRRQLIEFAEARRPRRSEAVR